MIFLLVCCGNGCVFISIAFLGFFNSIFCPLCGFKISFGYPHRLFTASIYYEIHTYSISFGAVILWATYSLLFFFFMLVLFSLSLECFILDHIQQKWVPHCNVQLCASVYVTRTNCTNTIAKKETKSNARILYVFMFLL